VRFCKLLNENVQKSAGKSGEAHRPQELRARVGAGQDGAMDLDLVFRVANFSTAPAWILLLVAPGWTGTGRFVHSVVTPILLAVAYALLLFTDMGGGGDANMFSLQGVMAIFDKPQTTIAAWIHYLVFDLFVGAWIVRDAERRGQSRLLVAPSLLGTWFFGPVGLGLYLAVRTMRGVGMSLVEESSPPATNT
jgi:hypothetical protein